MSVVPRSHPCAEAECRSDPPFGPLRLRSAGLSYVRLDLAEAASPNGLHLLGGVRHISRRSIGTFVDFSMQSLLPISVSLR